MGNFPFGANPDLQLQATTGTAGYALADSTGTIISWTAPDDGNPHRFHLFGLQHVSSAETGGEIQVVYTGPFSGADQHFSTLWAGGSAADTTGSLPDTVVDAVIGSGTTVSVAQETALTAGAAVIWIEIWGS